MQSSSSVDSGSHASFPSSSSLANQDPDRLWPPDICKATFACSFPAGFLVTGTFRLCYPTSHVHHSFLKFTTSVVCKLVYSENSTSSKGRRVGLALLFWFLDLSVVNEIHLQRFTVDATIHHTFSKWLCFTPGDSQDFRWSGRYWWNHFLPFPPSCLCRLYFRDSLNDGVVS